MVKKLRTGKVVTLDLDAIKPYWRNPRIISTEQVEAIGDSMANFGYSQPIVVDGEHTIIIGHTRYNALRSSGVTEVEVMVVDYLEPSEVKQLRIVDNRAGEFSFWDYDKLAEEIDEVSSDYVNRLFPEAAAWGDSDEDIARRIDENEEAARAQAWSTVDMTIDLVCPSCFHEWTQTVTRDEILTGRIIGKHDHQPEGASS